MIGKIVNLVAKLSGLGFVFDKINGYKTYIGAVISILSGIVQLLEKVLALQGASDWLAFAKGLPQDPGLALVSVGLIGLGIRHKLDKGAALPQ